MKSVGIIKMISNECMIIKLLIFVRNRVFYVYNEIECLNKMAEKIKENLLIFSK